MSRLKGTGHGLEQLESRRLLAIADLDVGFGTSGKALLDYLGNGQDGMNVFALTPAGKLLVAGTSATNNVNKATLSRFNTDGSPDTSLAPDGKLKLAAPAAFADLIVNADGTMTALSGAAGAPLMRRFTSTGAVDGTFTIALNPSGTPTDLAVTDAGLFYASIGNNLIRVNANGGADNAFSGDGLMPIPLDGNQQFRPQRVAALPDGSVIVGGQYGTTNPNIRNAAFRHYNLNGTLDTTFGTGGTLSLAGQLSTFMNIDRLKLLPDGSLLALSTDLNPGITLAQSYAVRFSAGGVLDNSWDGDGIATINYLAQTGERIPDLIPDGNGGFLGVGLTLSNTVGTDLNSFIFRMTNGGVVDNTFANNGFSSSYTVPFESQFGNLGLILTGGWLYHATSTDNPLFPPPQDAFIVRFNPTTGVQDMGFGTNGRVVINYKGSTQITTGGSTLMPDGGVAYAGWVQNEFNPQLVIGRLTESGQPMPGFGTNGVVEVGFGTSSLIPFDIAAQTDGKMVIVGRTLSNDGVTSFDDYFVARLNANGTPDTGFGTGGFTSTSFPDQTGEFMLEVEIDPTCRIYASGTRTNGGISNGILVRYSSSGQLDTGFGSGGRVLMNITGDDNIGDIVPLPDGTVLLSGITGGATEPQEDAFVVHVLEDGSFDGAFGTGGRIRYDVGNTFNAVNGIARSDTGLIYTCSFVNGVAIEFRRFTETGQPDMTFGVVGYTGPLISGMTSVIDMDLTPGGRMLVYGGTGGSPSDVYLYSFSSANGAIENSFGVSGKMNYNLSSAASNDTAIEFFVRPDGHWLATGTGAGPGEQFNDFSAMRIVGEDSIAPTIIARSFEYETTQAIHVDFSEHVTPPTAAQLVLESLGPETIIPVQPGWVSYNGTTRRLTVTPSPRLGDGNYKLTIVAGTATDVAGNTLAANFPHDFFVLIGDTNRDRRVDITDLGVLATNWQQSPRVFSQGDFNYDGMVDITDLGMLATSWQKNLPAPAAPAARASGKARRVFDGIIT